MELSVLGRVRLRRALGPRGKLVQEELITVNVGMRFAGPKDLLTTDVELTSRAFQLLVGDRSLSEDLVHFSAVEEPMATFDQVVLPPADKRRLLSVVERHDTYLEYRRAWGFEEIIRYGRGVLVLFHGKPGTGKTMTAHALAHHMGRRVLNVDIPTFVEHGEAARFLPGLFREARHDDSVVNVLLKLVERQDGVVPLATNLPDHIDRALDRRLTYRLHFPLPDASERAAIWRHLLPPTAPGADTIDVERLGRRYELAGGHIRNAVYEAAFRAASADAPLHQGLVEEAAREEQEGRRGATKRPAGFVALS